MYSPMANKTKSKMLELPYLDQKLLRLLNCRDVN